MCFSNLPVEFDEDGNPYLASEAEDVEHPDACGCDSDVSLDDANPDEVFDEVLAAVPESVREQVRAGVGNRNAPDDRDRTNRRATTEDARSD